MPINTPNLNIPKPEGNENFTRDNFNQILESIDQNASPKNHTHPSSDLPSGSTSAKGIVQLSTSTTSASTSLAATPSAVKAAMDKANDVAQAVSEHSADEVKHITAAERTTWNAKETPAGALTKVEQNSFKTVKTNKDANGIYTTVEHRRKSDDKLVRRSVLSGGTSPQYTTRTVTFYAADGTTVAKTDTFTLTYDADGDLISEV